jgi:protein-glutamine gamma-glutamyltransferase
VKIPPKDGRDDIVRWLDSNEPGFCEYFAAGFTVLARAAGYPARVVAGFHGGALNGFENYYMVRNSDAHAWAEIYDGTSAWIRVDPTPGGGAAIAQNIAAAAQEQDSSWSARLDSLRVLWYRRIVNFDSRQQVQMIDQVKTFTTGTGAALKARLDEFGRRVKAWLAGPWDWKRAARSGGLVVGGVALAWTGWRLAGLGWQHWRQWRQPEQFDPVRREAGRWLGKIAEGGVRNAESRAVRDELQRLRYGRRETWPEPRGVFRRAQRARKIAKQTGPIR